MHIPDGYLGPKTFGACYLLVAPFWWRAWASLRSRIKMLEVPHIALASAFVFVIMMFNVPVPGGTTGHAVGAAAVAIALGVWPAVLAVSFALLAQALIFADGGVTAYGANCLNMAVIEPLIAVAAWRLLRPSDLQKHPAHVFGAAFAAGYAGIVVAAFATGVELGLQPVLERAPGGGPLYSAFSLSVAVPAMTLAHLIIGILEGCVTGFLVRALARSPGTVITPDSNLIPAPALWRRKTFWAVTTVVVVLTPLGLWIPRLAAAKDAWGGWSPDDAAKRAGLAGVPAGMARLADLWHGLMPDYGFHATQNHAYESVQYVIAAVGGIAAIAIAFALLGKWQKARMEALSRQSE